MEFSELITVPKVDGATLYRANQTPIDGTLCITPFYLILSSRSRDPPEELWLLHRSVDCVERRNTSDVLTLKCKDFQILKLLLPSIDICLKVATSIEALSNLDDETMRYPFHNHLSIEVVEDGWMMHSIENEFNRIKSFIGNEWRLSRINQDYKICPTYPPLVIVLKCIPDEVIFSASAYRHKRNFPILAYYHKSNGMVLMRAGQPLSRGGKKRNKDDERMVNGVFEVMRKAPNNVENGGVEGGKEGVEETGGGVKDEGMKDGEGKDGGVKDGGQRMRGYMVDTRSPSLVKMDATRGGGTEPEQFYPLWRGVSHPIDTPTSLQESLVKLIEACLDAGSTTDRWLSRLEASNWLTSVGGALSCGHSVARYLDNGGSVLLRGGGEVDNQLVVSSIAQVLLNPDCRTIVGFEALIEREWIQAGHPFSKRCIKGAFSASKSKTEAPTFLLFLDCIFQIWQQFSCSFEFNSFFLTALFKHAYASQFGTFLFDNEREREMNKLKERTVSLWSYINSPKVIVAYINPLYTPDPTLLHPSTSPSSLQLWTQVYQAWQRFIPRQESLRGVVEGLMEEHKDLKNEVVKMRKYVVKLQKEALRRNLIPCGLP